MPGSPSDRNKLGKVALATDNEVSRHFQRGDLFEIRMGVCIKTAQEKVTDRSGIEVARGKTDSVDHQRINGDAFGPVVAMGRTKAGVPSQ